MEDIAQSRATLDDARRARLAQRFEDGEHVGELGFRCDAGEEGADDGAVFDGLGGSLGSVGKQSVRGLEPGRWQIRTGRVRWHGMHLPAARTFQRDDSTSPSPRCSVSATYSFPARAPGGPSASDPTFRRNPASPARLLSPC